MWIIVRLLIGIAILAILEIYFLRKAGPAVKILFPSFFQEKYKIIKRVFIIWLNLYPLVLILAYIYFAITSEGISAPESFFYDYSLVYPFWILFLLMMQVTVYLLIIDLVKLFLLPLYKKHKSKTLKFQGIIVLVSVTFFMVYIPGRIIYDYNTVTVSNTTYTNNNLPDALNNFKIVFVSDIQADRYTDITRLRKFIDKVNEANPDLVLIAGDLITTGPDYIKTSGLETGKIKSKCGVYTCVGDHDNWAYRNDYRRSLLEVKESLLKNNIEMVDNDQREVLVEDATIGITFITNTYVGKVSDNVLDSLSSNSTGDLTIFLTHQPREDLINNAFENDFDLFLAGHTHGGQITLLFPFIQLTPTLIETNYIKGDFWFEQGNNKMLAVVTGGLGMSLAPIRYNSTPEISIITLRKKD